MKFGQRVCATLLLVAFCVAASRLSHAQLLVANNGDTPGLPQAWNVDPDSGNASPLWGTAAGIEVWGMAYDPNGQAIYATSGSQLFAGGTSETPTPLGVVHDGAGNALTMPGLAWANGGLYGVRGVDNEAIFVIDVDTLVATPVLDFPELEYDFGGLAFNPNDGLFYGTSDSLAAEGVGLYSLDVFGDGSITQVTAYPAGEFDIDGLAIGNNVAYLIEDDTGNTIYPFDLANGVYLTSLPNPFVAGEVFSAGAFITASTVDCDFNGDSVCDCQDVDALVAAIVAGTNSAEFDLNGDGFVDLADQDQWLADAGAQNLASGSGYLPGDANLDGDVNGADFLVWNANKFSDIPAWCSADFNADGTVDGADFLIWNANKFTSADFHAVPEPDGLWLLPLLLLAWRRVSDSDDGRPQIFAD